MKARINSESEVIRAALRLLEERGEKLALLRAALIEGEQSGITCTKTVYFRNDRRLGY